MYLQLVRSEQIEKDGEPIQTLGWLYVHNDEGETVGSFATLELPWKGNKTNISCIPPAPGGYESYTLKWLEDSPSFPYEHYLVKEVKGRTHIKIHRGNYYTQIEGCILVGTGHTDINKDGVADVIDSTYAMNQLVALLGKNEHKLDIKFL